MNQQLFAEQMWIALLGEFYEGKIASASKGTELFQVASLSDERILVRLTPKDKCV
jgi:hypothetical protein